MLLTLRQRLILFACLAIVGFLISGLLGGFLMLKFGQTTAMMRIAAVIQSVFQLIIPALITALLITRRPAEFLAIKNRIDARFLIPAIAAMVCSIPAMNVIIEMNASLSLPESMKGLEDTLRMMEDRAAASIELLQGGHTVANLIMNILIVGVLAGFGEELFFRGTFMRMLTTGRVNRHVAVWIVAIVFSAIHLQFYGFVPRMLLGAYFGYLLLWTRCLWVPIIIHATNNIIYVIAQYISGGTQSDNLPIDNLGTGSSWPMAAVSAVVTTAILWYIYKNRKTVAD